MEKHIKKLSVKWILVAVFWTTIAYLVILSAGLIYFSSKEASNSKKQAVLLAKLKNVENLAYIRNTKNNYGGETPAGAIYMYYEFLQSKQYPLASTIFTAETRDEHLSKLKDISEPAMRKFVEVLRLSEKEAAKVDASGERVEIPSPIKVVVKKVMGYAGSPVWQIESIDYQLP